MLQNGRRYLFMTLGYFYSGIVESWSPGHAILSDARIHCGDVGKLEDFDFNKGNKLKFGYIVPLPGTGVCPLD